VLGRWHDAENEDNFELLSRFNRPELYNFMVNLGYVDVGIVTGFKRMKPRYVYMDWILTLKQQKYDSESPRK
jgi:hypothetical protein